MNSIRAVLFDFGNTLFAHDPLPATVARLADHLGAPMESARAVAVAAEIDAAAHTSAELMHPRDLDAAVWQARWALLYGLADREVAGLGGALLADMHDPDRWMPFADTGAVLEALKTSGIRVGVVSNTGWNVRTAFARHGFAGLIDSYTLSYEAGCTKPDPRIFATACSALGVDPANTLMVGDDPRADSGAVTAGLRVLLLPPTPPGTDNALSTVLAIR
jgi:HAD superfamily hydrolase (TIGR01493 family)